MQIKEPQTQEHSKKASDMPDGSELLRTFSDHVKAAEAVNK